MLVFVRNETSACIYLLAMNILNKSSCCVSVLKELQLLHLLLHYLSFAAISG